MPRPNRGSDEIADQSFRIHHGGIANVVGRGDFDQVHTQHPPLFNQAVNQLADLYSTQSARCLRHYRVRQKKGR
jgi:hypothetical protein